MRVTVIDNFDSFTFNLVDYFQRLECQVRVYRNDVPIEMIAAVCIPAVAVFQNIAFRFKRRSTASRRFAISLMAM